MMVGCGDDAPTNTPTDAGPADTGTVTDRGNVTPDTGRPDTGTPDAGRTQAGGPCMADEDCGDGELGCLRFLTGPGFCTNTCEQGSASAERTACGGVGGTCLGGVPLAGMGGMRLPGACTRTCSPTANTVAAGACPAGQVCTGFWYNNTGGMPDDTGCWAHCAEDSHCAGAQNAMGMATPTCNVRTGQCGTAAVNNALLPDGAPCNPQAAQMTMMPQCRGICFSLSAMRPTEGLCGSFLNTRTATACPDSPDAVQPRAAPGDNMAICIFKNCTTNSDCTGRTICIYPEDAMGVPATTNPRTCLFPTTAQPTGVTGGGDGGMPTDATTPTDAPAPADVPATDTPAPTDVPATDAATATDASTADAAG